MIMDSVTKSELQCCHEILLTFLVVISFELNFINTLSGPNLAGDPENLYQISLLIDHLKHEEVLFREQASRSLALIGI